MPTSIDEKILPLDYEPTNSAKPVLKKNPMTIHEITVEVEPHWTGECETSATARMYWDWHNREWVAFVKGEFLEGYHRGEQVFDSFEKGPLRLNEALCKKLLEVYNVPESEINLQNAPMDACVKFVQIYKMPADTIDMRIVSLITPRALERMGKK